MLRKRIFEMVSIGLLIILILRLFNNHVDGVRYERQWYISQLNFEFSTTIDTVRSRHILFHLKEGDIDWKRESCIKNKLKLNGGLDLFLYRSNNKIELRIDNFNQYMKGDIVYLNSNKNMVRIYRENKLLSQYELAKSIKGRPF